MRIQQRQETESERRQPARSQEPNGRRGGVSRTGKTSRHPFRAGPGRFMHRPEPLQLLVKQRTDMSGFGGRPLFCSMTAEMRQVLQHLEVVLDTVMPLRAAHRRDLPDAVHELSERLTSSRGSLEHPYWSSARLTSAYLRYFFPWNLVRMFRLLPGLPLPRPGNGDLLVDFGSGPLTVPIALWFAFPQWRNVSLSLLAVDTSGQAIELGKALFRMLAPGSPWHIRSLRAPWHKAIHEVTGHPLLVTAGNVLNELAEHREKHGSLVVPQSERLEELAFELANLVASGGAVLSVEPGTRLGGTLTAQLRAGGMKAGFRPLSPCPHAAACPLLREDGSGSSSLSGGWCHASLDITGSPAWLLGLTAAAGLTKTTLSMAHVLLQAADEASPEQSETRKTGKAPLAARILSDPFVVPDVGMARYACTGVGLAMVKGAASVPQGALVRLEPVKPHVRDAKTGALLMHLTE